MKKLLYILVFSLLTGMSVTSCTEENVEPTLENGGGADIRE
jgi:hypothetical protein